MNADQSNIEEVVATSHKELKNCVSIFDTEKLIIFDWSHVLVEHVLLEMIILRHSTTLHKSTNIFNVTILTIALKYKLVGWCDTLKSFYLKSVILVLIIFCFEFFLCAWPLGIWKGKDISIL